MSAPATEQVPGPASGDDTAPPTSADRPSARAGLGLLTTPLVLLLACAALYLYLGGQDLDEIELRSINRQVLTGAFVAHLRLVGLSTAAVIIIAIPLGVLLTRPALRPAAGPLLAFFNVGQAIPSIGILVLLAVAVGVGFKMAVLALVLASILPVLRNTMVGIQGVDQSVIDAARGMGLSKTTVLFRVELPLAVPVMLAGLRVAVILNVGTATLATFTNAGGLGDVIESGIVLGRTPVLLTGSVLTAVLALGLDWIFGLIERLLSPRGL